MDGSVVSLPVGCLSVPLHYIVLIEWYINRYSHYFIFKDIY